MKKLLFIIILSISGSITYCQRTGCISGNCTNGYGTFVWGKDTEWAGDKYVGEFKDGYRNGQGTYYYHDNMQYSGQYSYNQMDGFGTFTWADGQKYVGEWKNSAQHGKGTHYYVDGTSVYGLWENGKMIQDLSEEVNDNQTDENENNVQQEVSTGCIEGDCDSGYGVYTWTTGEKYEGNWQNGKRNGFGSNYYADGNVYMGEWYNDQQQGKGTMIYANGDMYTGDYKLHKLDGQGTYTYKDGRKYIGQYKNQYRHGIGTMYYSDGRTEAGNWEYDIYKGKSNYTPTNSTGCISGDCSSGYGVYVWTSGEKYEGYWDADKRNGEGTNYYANGDKYNGNFKDDLCHGSGTYTFKNGDTYSGQYIENRRNGQGTFIYKSTKDKYEGQWKDDNYDGEGTYYYANGTIKSGIWKNSEYIGKSESNYGCISGNCDNGSGTYVYQTGNKYVGSFKGSKYNGQGTLFFANGDKYVGDFKSGNYNGFGTYTFAADGRKYVGEWKNSLYEGEGTMYYSNGDIKSGLWKNGEYSGKSQTETGKIPAITWLSPEYYTTNASSGSLKIKLCVESATPLINVQIFSNDQMLVDNANRGLKVISTACDFTIEREITLLDGTNTLKVIVENGSGKTTSDIRTVTFKKTTAENRVALIIGNGNYPTMPLKNPVNDANAIAKELRNLGFEVISFTDMNQNDMKKQIRTFGEKLAAKGGVGLFYFAGHGIQLNGENYLVPVDAKIEKEQDVELEAVSLKRILGEMDYARNDMNIVILDACRNNPFARSWRSTGNSGLATTTAPQGTFIAYATAPGSVAADGEGQNGLYTQELLKALNVSNIKIEDVFKTVRNNVYQKSNKQQVPWENSSIFGDFYFKK
jgi:hypothetical protein